LVTAKAKTKAKVGSKVVKGASAKAPKRKTVSKTAVKTAKKTSPKPAPKTAAKTVRKVAPKPAPKPAPKSKPKPKLKPAAKPAPKIAARRTAVTVAKAPAKVIAKKPVAAMPPPAGKSLARVSTAKVGGRLSETEVIKQARTDYMSRQQMAFFKQRLLDLQNELRENAGATTEHLRELSVAPDPADRATLEEEHALELRTRDRERKLLKKVQSALMRIEDGSYGYCEETGEPIGIQRLMARPTATLTIEAQERRELKQKMYGE
jgi:DnaK suppressor protein